MKTAKYNEVNPTFLFYNNIFSFKFLFSKGVECRIYFIVFSSLHITTYIHTA